MHLVTLHFKKGIQQKWPLLGILILATLLRFYQLDLLPAETFGDMVENIIHVEEVLIGKWQLIYGFDGREGLYFYIAALASFIFGNHYLNLKIVTATVGVLTVFTTFALVRELTNKRTAFLSSFLLAVSKWHLVYSRIGFRTVFTPLFTSIVYYFFFRALRTKRTLDVVLCSIFLGLGLYTYTAFKFVVLSVFGFTFMILIQKRKHFRALIKPCLLAFTIFASIATPQVFDISLHPDLYVSHPGPMMLVDGKLPPDTVPRFLNNSISQLGMLHVKGDSVYRINPYYEPELDVLTGIFFLIGIVSILFFYRNTQFFLLTGAYFFLQLPAILVLNMPENIPSATRTTCIIPLVFLVGGMGVELVLKKIPSTRLRAVLIMVVFSIILGLNLNSYFVKYPQYLPNKNQAFDQIMTDYINALPVDTKVYLVGGSWGDEGQPHPGAILNLLHPDHTIERVEQNVEHDLCPLLKFPDQGDVYLLINPELEELPKEYCLKDKYQKMIHTKYGDTVFLAVSTKPIL